MDSVRCINKRRGPNVNALGCSWPADGRQGELVRVAIGAGVTTEVEEPEYRRGALPPCSVARMQMSQVGRSSFGSESADDATVAIVRVADIVGGHPREQLGSDGREASGFRLVR